MASEKTLQILEEIKGLTILEMNDLVKGLEEAFGVTAAPVAVAGGAAAGAFRLAEPLGAAGGGGVAASVGRRSACLAVCAHPRDAGLPPLHFRAARLETGVAVRAVHRGGIYTGDAADGGFAIPLCDRTRPWLAAGTSGLSPSD